MQDPSNRLDRVNGGRFDFDDGGTYCGGWEDGKAHGHGVCTGPKGQGEYSGSWHYGFEMSGVYTWPNGNTFEGQWQKGKRHGLGIEMKGRWTYRGEWTQGLKGRYGIRESLTSGAKYEGTWANGLQDGYGSETYADGGTYQGQWLRGMRHGYGVRQSVQYGLASHYRPKTAAAVNLRSSMSSLRSGETDDLGHERDKKLDEARGGFVLKAKSDEPSAFARKASIFQQKKGTLKRSILQGLRIKKQRSTGDINKRSGASSVSGSIRSNHSAMSAISTASSQSGLTSATEYMDSNLSFVSQDDITESNVTETYMGEWKNDKRSGFGISERSDGLKYEGEWYNNKKYGYGVTTFKDGSKEEGKYKNNVLIASGKKNKLFLLRQSKLRERIDSAVQAALRGSQVAKQKAEIAVSRTISARRKVDDAEMSAKKAQNDATAARVNAKHFAPDFYQPGPDVTRTPRPAMSDDRQKVSSLHPDLPPMGSAHNFQSHHHGSSQLSDQSLPVPNHYPVTNVSGSGSEELSLHVPTINVNHEKSSQRLGFPEEKVGSIHVTPAQNMPEMHHPNQRYPKQEELHDSYKGRLDDRRLDNRRMDSRMHGNKDIYGSGARYDQRPPMMDRNKHEPYYSRDSHDKDSGSYRYNDYDYARPSDRHDRRYDAYDDEHYGMRGDRPYLKHRAATSDHDYHTRPYLSQKAYSTEQYPYDRFDDGDIRRQAGPPNEPRARPTNIRALGHEGSRFAHPNSSDWTPDSGVSGVSEASEEFGKHMRDEVEDRRKTLPAIMNLDMMETSPSKEMEVHKNLRTSADDTVLARKQPYVVDGTIRKRIKAETHKSPESDQLPSHIVLEPVSEYSTGRRKSLPDAHNFNVVKKPAFTREEISVLSALRREEVRSEQAFQEKEAKTFFLFRSSVRNWFFRHRLAILLLSINALIGYLFYELVT